MKNNNSKKRLSKYLSLIVMMAVLVALMAGAVVTVDAGICYHNSKYRSHHDEVRSCEGGYPEHYECSKCGSWVTSIAGVWYTTDKEIHNGHTYKMTDLGNGKHAEKCSWCGAVKSGTEANHSSVWKYDMESLNYIHKSVCTVCGFVSNKHDHRDNITKISESASTCETNGNIEHYKCNYNGCGLLFTSATGAIFETKSRSEIEKPLLQHSYSYKDLGNGKHQPYCTNGCNQPQPGTSAEEHTYGNWITEKDSTCTESGSEYRVCSKCNNVEKATIPAAGKHTLQYKINSNGTHTVTCSAGCGYSETVSHSMGNWSTTKAATCGAKGTETCSCVCGYKETRDIQATGKHTWATAATDLGNGKHAVKCTVCGTVQSGTEESHKYEWTRISYKKLNVSVDSVGVTCHIQKCACGLEDSSTMHFTTKEDLADTVSYLGLTLNSFEKKKVCAATCKKTGVKAEFYECPVCGLGFTNSGIKFTQINKSDYILDLDSNNHVNIEYKPATDASAGHVKYCKDENKKISDEVIPHTNWKQDSGADSNGWVTDVAKSCTVEGKYHRTCADCGYIQYKTENPTGPHAYSWVDNGNGTHTGTCSKCRDEVTQKHTESSNFEHVNAVSPQCETDGNIEYWHCKDCGKYFSNAAGTVEITEASTKSNRTGHSYIWKVEKIGINYHCHVCQKCGTEIEDDRHFILENNFVEHAEVPATCQKDGTEKYYSCSHDGCTLLFSAKKSDSAIDKPVVIKQLDHVYTYRDNGDGTHTGTCKYNCGTKTSKIDHNLVKQDEQAAKCEETGTKAHYKCSDCGALYGIKENGDPDKSKPLSSSDLTIKELGHNYEWQNLLVHTGTCTRCKKIVTHNFLHYDYYDNGDGTHTYICHEKGCTISGKGDHIWDKGEVTTQPTCESEGEKTFHCTIEGCPGVKTESITKLSHQYHYTSNNNGTHHVTCTQSGCNYSTDVACTATHVEKQDSSCSEEGNLEYWYCKDCGECFADAQKTKLITKAEIVIAKKEHNFKWQAKDRGGLNYDATSHHVMVCQTCGEEKSGSEHIAAKEDYAESIGKIPGADWKSFIKHKKGAATCVATGAKEDCYECPECNLLFTYDSGKFSLVDEKEYILPIDENNHDYKIIPNPENKAAGHIKKCKDCTDIDATYGTSGLAQHEWESSENDGYVTVTPPTCMENGLEKRVCKVCKDGAEAYYETRPIVAKGEHTFEPWHDNGDGTHSRECTADGCDQKETNSHGTLTHHEEEDSTCTATGNYEYWYCETCKGYFNDAAGLQPTTLEAVTIAKKPHVYTTWKTKENEYLGQKYYTHVKVCSCGAEETGSEHLTTSDWGWFDSVKNAFLEWLGISNAYTYNTISETDSTCKTQGTHACYQCPVCNQYFSGKGITASMIDESEVFKELDPSNHEDTGYNTVHQKENPADGHYQYCSKCETTDESVHHYGDWQTTKVPTCVKKGEHKRICSDCQYEDVQELEKDPNKHNYGNWEFDNETGQHMGTCLDCKNATIKEDHKLTEVTEVSPTCTKEGNIHYWHCEVCDSYFSDNGGTEKIEESATVVEATGHKLEWAVKDQSSTDPYGLSCHIKKCTNANCSYEDSSTMHYAAKAEFANAGNDLAELLTKVGLSGTSVTAFNKHNKKAATCSATGLSKDYYECTYGEGSEDCCNLSFTINEVTVESTLTSESISQFFNRIKELTTKPPYFIKVNPSDLVTEKDPSNHNYTEFEPVNGSEDTQHINKCSWCHETNLSYGTNGVSAHNWDTSAEGADENGWVIDSSAKCDAEGSKHRTCKDCAKVVTEAIDKTPHQYVWSYESGNSQHKGTCSCGDVVYRNHNIVPVEEQPSSCKEKGHAAHYKCSDCKTLFSDSEGANTTTLNDLELDLKPHDYKWIVKETNVDYAGVSCHIKKCNDCEFEDESSKHYAVKAEVKNTAGALTSLLEKIGLSGINNVTALTEHTKKAATCTEPGAKETYFKCPEDDLCFIERPRESTELTWNSLKTGEIFSNIWSNIQSYSESYFIEKNESDYLIPIDSSAHDFTKYVTKDGDEAAGHIRICSRCSESDPGYSLTAHEWDTTAEGADANGWVIDQQSTCITGGTKHRLCKFCEYRDEGTVEPGEHRYAWTYDQTANTYTQTCTEGCNDTHAKVKLNAQDHATITVDYASNKMDSVLTIVPEAGYYVSAITESKNSAAANNLPDNTGSVTNGISYNSGTATYTFNPAETDVIEFNVTVKQELPLTGSYEVPLWDNLEDRKANIEEYEALVFSKIVDTTKAPLSSTDVEIKYWYSLDTLLGTLLSINSGSESLARMNYDAAEAIEHQFGNKLVYKVADKVSGLLSELLGKETIDTSKEHLKITYTSKGEGDKFTTYSVLGDALLGLYKNKNIFSVTLTDTYKVSFSGTDSAGCKTYGFDEKHKDYIYLEKKDGGSEVSFFAEANEGYKLLVQLKGLLNTTTVEPGLDGKYQITVTDDETIYLKFLPDNITEQASDKGSLIVNILETLGDKVKTGIEASPIANYYIKGVKITDAEGKEVEVQGDYKDGNFSASFLDELKGHYNIEVLFSPILPEVEEKVLSLHNQNPTGEEFVKYVFDSLVDEEQMPGIFGEGSSAKFADVIKVEYFAGPKKLLELNNNELITKIVNVAKAAGVDISGWKEINTSEKQTSKSEANNAKAQGTVEDILNRLGSSLSGNLEKEVTEIVEEILDENDLYHNFGSRDSETIRVTYNPPAGEQMYPKAEIVAEVTTGDMRTGTEVVFDEDTCSIVWKSESLYDAILKHPSVKKDGGEKITSSSTDFGVIVKDGKGKEYSTKEAIDGLDAGTYTATITYGGTNEYKSSEAKLNVVVEKASVTKFEVEDISVVFDGNEHGAKVTSENSNGDKIPYITVAAGVDASLQGKAFLNFCQDTNVEILGYSVTKLYNIVKTVVAETNGDLTLDALITNLNSVSDKLDTVIATVKTVDGNELWKKVQDVIKSDITTEAIEKLESVSAYLDTTINYLEETRKALGRDVTLSLDHNPVNAGIYGVYGMSFDKNYKTESDLGYITIKPVEKYSIVWNTNLDATVFLTSDTGTDFGASLYEIGAEGKKAGAESPQITYIVYGINNNLELELKRTDDPSELQKIFETPGTYKEVALITGNEATAVSRNVTITKPVNDWSITSIVKKLTSYLSSLIKAGGSSSGDGGLFSKIINLFTKLSSSLTSLFKS